MKKVFIVLFILEIIFPTIIFAEAKVKKPNVAGQFYNASRDELSKEVERYLTKTPQAALDKKTAVLISPHAGYVYSAPVASYGYKAISGRSFKTVVIIGLSHYHRFEGFAIWPDGQFETPLGSINVDYDLAQKLMQASDKVKSIPEAFEKEHSIEVQLPFLQKIFKDIEIVPILTGRPDLKNCEQLASILAKVIAGSEDILLLISTDMSHYYDYKTALTMDQGTLQIIQNVDVKKFWEEIASGKIEMCNFVGITTALFYAQKQGLDKVEVLKYANSGDTTGDKSRVVGYSSVIFYSKEGKAMENEQKQKNSPLSQEHKEKLLKIARETIEQYIQTGQVLSIKEPDPRLNLSEGAFVTIHNKGELRGCIGQIVGAQPLYLTVRDMAIASATKDFRFDPIKKEELESIDMEISVLSMPWKITDPSQIEVGMHGVIIQRGSKQGLFLPQVAPEQGWDREELLTNLCVHKAGLAPDAWRDSATTIEIFTADVFSEKVR